MTTPSIAIRHQLRDLNDAFRTAGPSARSKWMVTRGVQELGPEFTLLATAAVRSFNSFTPDNDPYGEHDFGAINIVGQHLFWKIDYYDLTLGFDSPDHADSSLSYRVLTIMLASEY